MILKRKIYNKLLAWKSNSKGTSALLIEGARRVGKSYIAEAFGSQEYKSHIIIDFSNVSDQIIDVFEYDKTDLDMFFNKLSVFYGVKLFERDSLIIFDEVQLYPKARQLIKHLVADGRYDYLETGSLITLKKNVQSIVIPSEEEAMAMYPIDFEEFLWALGDEVTYPYIRECYENSKPMGEAIHRKTMTLFRQYLLVGGMPQAVLAYMDKKDFEAADSAKRRILQLYRNDVSKFAEGYESKVLSIFDGIPSQLSKHEKKYTLATLQTVYISAILQAMHHIRKNCKLLIRKCFLAYKLFWTNAQMQKTGAKRQQSLRRFYLAIYIAGTVEEQWLLLVVRIDISEKTVKWWKKKSFAMFATIDIGRNILRKNAMARQHIRQSALIAK